MSVMCNDNAQYDVPFSSRILATSVKGHHHRLSLLMNGEPSFSTTKSVPKKAHIFAVHLCLHACIHREVDDNAGHGHRKIIFRYESYNIKQRSMSQP